MIDEFIKRDTAYNYLTEYYNHRTDIQHQNLRKALNAIPSADVVPVVRCKDCKHRPIVEGDYISEPGEIYSDYTCPYLCDDCWYNRMPEDGWFCNHGERKDGGT